MKFDTKEEARILGDQILFGNSCKGIPNQSCMGCGEEFYMKNEPRPTEPICCSAKCGKEVEQLLERQ